MTKGGQLSLQHPPILCLQFRQLGRDYGEAVGVALAFALPVFLVIVLGWIPRRRALDGGHRALPGMLIIPAGNGRRSRGALRIVQREQRGAVLGAQIIALPVKLRWIMRGEVDIEDRKSVV